MTLGEKIFVGIPACIILLLLVDATWSWTVDTWIGVFYEFTSGYLMWIIWDNRHSLRNHHHG
jgi:hypothetical protein